MNWPEKYQLINDSLIVDISLPEENDSGIILLKKNTRNDRPDCYVGKVTETGSQCKLVKVGDSVVFTRWEYSQSDVDENRICLREVDLVIVNDKCVNNYTAVKLYAPKKKMELITPEVRRERPKNFWGQIIDMDRTDRTPKDAFDLTKGDIVLFQYMEDYQYRVGEHTMVFRNDYDVVIAKMEDASA